MHVHRKPVAERSTKLKIVTQSEQRRRGQELDEIADRIWNKASGKLDDMVATMKDDKFLAARKAAHDYNLMPHLHILFAPTELAGGCAGSVDARLSAYLDTKTNSMEIVPTHSDHPRVRGTDLYFSALQHSENGSPPRTGDRRVEIFLRVDHLRITPAYGGQTNPC
jgi:hypothetical protein